MVAKKTAKPARESQPIGRPSLFSQELADKICELIADGKSLRRICESDGMPSKTTVMRWLADDEREAFRDQYACAREAQADKYAEEIIDISDEEVTMVKKSKHSGDEGDDSDIEVVFDPTAVARNRLRVDARKWYASKLAPKKYGDKLAVGGADDLPAVQITTIERVIVDPNKKQ